MATATFRIDTDELAAAVLAKLELQYVMVRREDIEHIAWSMFDCFSDAEANLLNRLRAIVGAPAMRKIGSGPNRGWEVVQ